MTCGVTAREYSAVSCKDRGISPRQVQRILKQLKNDGRIEHVGANRNGVYRIL